MSVTSNENKKEYREQVNAMGRKEFTFLKMQEYGFWPKDLPTPYERQQNETEEDYKKRKELLQEYQKLSEEIAKVYGEIDEINKKLLELQKEYQDTWDYEKVRQEVSRIIMKESIERRAQRKAQREEEQERKREAWQKKKAENIVFIGKGYSSYLSKKETNKEKLKAFGLPVLETDRELAEFLEISYPTLRFFTYHRDVVKKDLYYRYEIPKKSGGIRRIAAPQGKLKTVQRKILGEILEKVPVSASTHGFLKEHSVVTGAKSHSLSPACLINIDLEDFFPTITFQRVRGAFQMFGYSGYIASLLAMLCTYCERIPIEVKGETCYVKISDRILPQGSPASPMLTNIICSGMDRRIAGLANQYGYQYTRYADDMSFSLEKEKESHLGTFLNYIKQIIEEEGFHINQKKTRILRPNTCQSVTGVVINGEEVGVNRKWVKNFRALLHHAKIEMEQGEISKERQNQITGRIAWLKSVNSERYQKLIEEGQRILKNKKEEA